MPNADAQITSLTAAVAPEAVGQASLAPADVRHAAEWGLASLLLSGVSAVVALLTVLFGTIYYANFIQVRPGRGEATLTVVFTGAIALLFSALSVASVFFGVIGLRSAGARRQPAGLPLAGTLLSVVVVLMWVAVTIGLVFEAADVLRRV